MANNKDFKVKNGLSAPTIKEKATVDVQIESQPYYAGKRNSSETAEEYLTLTGVDDGGAQGLIVDLAPITGQNGAAFFIDPDGKYLFIADTTTNDYKLQRCLFGTSTPFRLDTVSISVNRLEKALGSSELDPWGGITFSPDGYTFLSTEGTFVYERTISGGIPWEINSLSGPTSHDMQSLSGLSPASTISGVTFGKDGTRLYLVDNLTDTICQANLSTAYDVGTITTSTSVKPYAGLYDPNPESNAATPYTSGLNQMRNAKFSEDGTQVFILDSGSANIWVFELSTPWEIATLRRPALKVYRSSAGYIDDVNKNIKDFFFMTGTDLVLLRSDDGIYHADLSGNKVDLDLSTNSSFNITLGEIGEYRGRDPYLGVSSDVERNAAGLFMNGLCKMNAATGDLKININANSEIQNQNAVIKIENQLKTWPIHALYYDRATTPTGSFVGPTSPRGHRLSDDGTLLRIIDGDSTTGACAIREYTLTTPWDITTLVSSPVASTGFNAEDTAMIDFMFNDDGTILYTLGNTNNRLYQYILTTPYDLSTHTYIGQNLNLTAQSSAVVGFLFNPDGTKGYYFAGNGVCYQYDFPTPWDSSVAVFSGKSLGGFSNTNNVRWGPNGYSLYLTHTNEQIIEWILHEPYNPLSVQHSQSTTTSTASVNRQTYIGHLTGLATERHQTTFAVTDTNEVRAYVFNPSGGPTWTVWQLEVNKPTINWPNNIYWKDGIAPEAPEYGETDVYVLNTTNGGHTYNGVVAIDGAK